MTSSSVCRILDMPDEILVKIILYFDAKERLALGHSCQKFNDLVFGDEELLRNLDFTTKSQVTEESDIQQYFNDENTYKKILKINTEGVSAARNLSSLINKAINLVELNVLSALHFKSVEELSCFLKPLVHLKQLSVYWPWIDRSYDNPKWDQLLEEPLGRLTYLSVKLGWYSEDFLLILQLCQQLEQLRMMVVDEGSDYRNPRRREHMKISSLKSVQIISSSNLGPIRNDFMSIVPDPAEWTDFSLLDTDYKLYLERNVEVCAELGQVERMPLPEYIAGFRDTDLIDDGWPLFPEFLLSRVIKVTHEDVPEKFCCLSPSQLYPYQPCLRLQIEEAKKLLEDPGYQISALHFPHVIERNCDVHLVGSAFPNLTKLFLNRIGSRNPLLMPQRTKPLRRRLRKKGSLVSEKDGDASNTDSAFKMLVENTPHLKFLEIVSTFRGDQLKYWDLDELYLISGWKNLTVIHLSRIPITDGNFLIEIGRECKKLEEIMLRDHSGEKCNYESKLLQMLQHCKNLRKLLIADFSSNHMPEMVDILSNCSRLEDVDLTIDIKDCHPPKLMSSVENMLRRCLWLRRFSLHLYSYQFCRELRCHVKKINSELNRSNLQFCIRGLD